MFRRTPRVLTIAIASAVLAAAAGSTANARRADPSATGLAPIRLGRPAPDFGFASNAGPSSLGALRGKTVVLNFWATYCEPCIGELDALARLGPAFGGDVVLIEVSEEPRDRTLAVLRDHGVGGNDVSDFERAIFDRYGVTPIPTTLVIGPDGTVRHVSIGALDWPELEGAVRATLPGASP